MNRDYLSSILHYDPHTGHFTWIAPRRGCSVGQRAGSVDKQAGYEQIGIDGKLYRSHRLAWLYVHGVMPEDEVDHINGVRSDNRIANLRAVPGRLNNQNRRNPNRNNSRKLLGVYREKEGGRFFSAIMKDRKSIYLGRFNTPEEAHAAYVAKRRELFEGNTL